MPNPYSIISTELFNEQGTILNAYTNAGNELSLQGAPDTNFLEIGYTGGKIIRIWDGAIVNSLPLSEQYRLYPQLGGLFNLAMRNLLYP